MINGILAMLLVLFVAGYSVIEPAELSPSDEYTEKWESAE